MIKDTETVDALRAFVRAQPDGAALDWVTITQATGVDMSTPAARRHFRDVCKREGRFGSSMRGTGVRLSSAQNAADIAEDHACTVARSVNRARSAVRTLWDRHHREMGERDKQRMLTTSSFFGAISLSSALATSRTRALPPGEAE